MKHKTIQRSTRQSWPIKLLTAAVIVGLTGTLAQAETVRKPIGDVEIYKAAEPGTATIFMMLDVSGSMTGTGGCKNTYSSTSIRSVVYQRALDANEPDGLLRGDDGDTVLNKTAPVLKNQTISYNTCKDSSGNIIGRSLIERLKIALVELLSDDVFVGTTLKDTGSLPDDYAIGVGSFTNSYGQVRVPTRVLTAAQRVELIDGVMNLVASGGTPTAYALAESGAYMMGTKAYSSSFNASVNSSKSGTNYNTSNYISPLSTKECSGNGIYLLTDGEPNSSDGKSLMDTSLKDSVIPLSVGSCSGNWGCMNTYAALLRNTASNSRGLPIKTATVGFGSTFAGLTGKRSISVNGKSEDVVDCESGSVSTNTRSLCRLGERKGDNETKTYGDGGFYYTENSEEIAASIVDFSASLVQIINTAPSGTITIPEDPYRAASQLPYAYLPMLDPDIVSTNSIWRGNLKKYNLNDGTLFGQSNSKLYKDVAGNLDANTQDVWQSGNFTVEGTSANNNIAAGGVYAQLRAPNGGLGSVRTLYVEDYTSLTGLTPILR